MLYVFGNVEIKVISSVTYKLFTRLLRTLQSIVSLFILFNNGFIYIEFFLLKLALSYYILTKYS